MNNNKISPWFLLQPRTAMTEQRLFCFPYAGGSAQVFHGWSNLLPSSIEVIAIQAPGKGSRLLEKPCTSVGALCEELLASLLPLLNEKPFSFFGHSNGAFIAFELACRLQAMKLTAPQKLLLSASPAPWTREFQQPFSEMSEVEFKEALRELKGTPPSILEDQSLFDLLLPGLRADFSMAENYSYQWKDSLEVETHVFYGEFDEITEHQIFSWQDNIAPALSFEKIPGDHFFIHSHTKELTDGVARKLSRPGSQGMRMFG